VFAKPWGQRAHRPGLFTKGDFKIDLRANTITCPAGEVEPFEPGDTVEFDPEACGACPLRGKCTQAASVAGAPSPSPSTKQGNASSESSSRPDRVEPCYVAAPPLTRARSHRAARGFARATSGCAAISSTYAALPPSRISRASTGWLVPRNQRQSQRSHHVRCSRRRNQGEGRRSVSCLKSGAATQADEEDDTRPLACA